MVEDVTWDNAEELVENIKAARLGDVVDVNDAYAKGLDDGYLDSLTETGDASEDERIAFNISSAILKMTSFDRLRGKTVREAYDAGWRHAVEFDHAVIRSLYELGVIRHRVFRLKVS